MSDPVPRVRMIAGPNGSGKSTVKAALPDHLFANFVNADEIEWALRRTGYFDLGVFGVPIHPDDFLARVAASPVLKGASWPDPLLSFQGSRLAARGEAVNSYAASAVASALRDALVRERQSFAFETVMSSPDKVRFLAATRQEGYRAYLYFVATDDPLINIDRVRHRVRGGGHDVPTEKIVARYDRCLELLPAAIEHADRAYIFDNSLTEARWIAEFTEGRIVSTPTPAPQWFQRAVLDKLPSL